MTGSHEVRGSIPLGSTNQINNFTVSHRVLNLGLCVSGASKRFGGEGRPVLALCALEEMHCKTVTALVSFRMGFSER